VDKSPSQRTTETDCSWFIDELPDTRESVALVSGASAAEQIAAAERSASKLTRCTDGEAEQIVAGDGAGTTAFRGITPLPPASLLNWVVRRQSK
jgi:hypothetical protein